MTNFTYSLLNFLFLILMIMPHHIKSDIPVHCLVSDTIGEWIFKIDTKTFNPKLNDQQTSCGHGFPNRILEIIGDQDNYPEGNYKEIKININNNHTVSENNEVVGSWTPIYDEGFIINYKDSIFTAHYKYYKPNKNNKEVSNCSKTSLGWFIPDKNNNKKNWSCFYALKTNAENKNLLPEESKNYKSFLQITPSKLIEGIKYEKLSRLVEEINNSNLSWKAQMYDEFKGLSFTELKEKLGIRKMNKIYDRSVLIDNEKQIFTQIRQSANKDSNNIDQDSEYVKNWDEILKYHEKDINEIDENNLAKNWDWRNVGGMNLVPNAYLQGPCGSCYTIASIAALESRLRIITRNEDQTIFSKQFPISCSFYTEGCGGGYPILVGKFSSEFELIPESCFPYTGKNEACQNVCDYSKNKKKYTVSKYGYIGKFYGNASEADMIKELRARGPIPSSIQIPSGFSIYSNGIFSISDVKSTNAFSKLTLFDQNIKWQSVDHSITIVGYGEENGIKYWVVLNSWGEKWGDKGFIKVKRGVNEINIESMVEFSNIKVEDF